MPSSTICSWPRGRTHVSCASCIAGRFFTAEPPGKIQKLTYDPTIPPLGIYWEKMTTLKDTCTPVSIVLLFTTARTWKQPKCSSTDEWIKKLWYIYTMKYYSALKSLLIYMFPLILFLTINLLNILDYLRVSYSLVECYLYFYLYFSQISGWF